MAENNAVSSLAKISGLLIIGGFILFAIGFSTHFWSYSEVYGYATEGLWIGCYLYKCSPIFKFRPHPAWFQATQIIECIGALAALGTTGLIGLYIFNPLNTRGNKKICILSIFGCFSACGGSLLGIIIYGAVVQENLSWSFALCLIGGIFFGVAGILLIISMLRDTKKRSMDVETSTPQIPMIEKN